VGEGVCVGMKRQEIGSRKGWGRFSGGGRG
jgi:hypothetical protein